MTGQYEIWVENSHALETGGPYALAWWATTMLGGGAVSGDYDGNGSVGPEDYDLWKMDFGSTSNLAADGNGNGVIDAADYTVWRDNLGSGSSSVAAVPEPSGMVLLAIAAVVGGWKGRSKVR